MQVNHSCLLFRSHIVQYCRFRLSVNNMEVGCSSFMFLVWCSVLCVRITVLVAKGRVVLVGISEAAAGVINVFLYLLTRRNTAWEP